jgi:hypothetical protein
MLLDIVLRIIVAHNYPHWDVGQLSFDPTKCKGSMQTWIVLQGLALVDARSVRQRDDVSGVQLEQSGDEFCRGSDVVAANVPNLRFLGLSRQLQSFQPLADLRQFVVECDPSALQRCDLPSDVICAGRPSITWG